MVDSIHHMTLKRFLSEKILPYLRAVITNINT